MKKAAPGGDEQFKTAAATILKYIGTGERPGLFALGALRLLPSSIKLPGGNVARAPDEDKFRRINLGNAAFQSRVAVVPGAIELLETLGFRREEDGSALVMPREAADPSALSDAGSEVNNALTNPFFGAL
ncbi:hypothetical protein MNEG_10060 [Monoraphidium neglectum]|uniref:PUB domain-containing protein n=1 Tax=Monoraphidium neglectum TaxID=145388 RepID=A0A0D2MAC0_9CHLO|nr:hypothetical protein MNEG_10060 [Monoraphidium neglectum]KIY97901.1 hypothetical protein MNEG_10060 [Monoraphidium neglectum]|eukprot:XP_013896921.1 hypothetical protein MNEG_10060 [Monoraphidium neglectum]